ncbi:hypothetical protein S40285_10655 [Stachybotrys chlorohalonatus IBT 40285]|uniref:Uncharacterized protein n=1 Tax=Stachybotrys chlorohalonatus (strain IBT 40285) TaxID=1283841 RepID=A0A084QLU4_STAC4|nr:hypothetical protein S40285_10655 [Stachybotrys chlorohalonata IBT 40285]
MTEHPNPCFYYNKYCYADGDITLEEYLQKDLSHVFQGARHPECERLSDADVASMAGFDMLAAAMIACMLHVDMHPSTASDTTLLNTPAFYQLIAATALHSGNRLLFNDIITNFPPAPGYKHVFSPENISMREIKFGDRTALSHLVFKGQADNGCDLWCAMIAAGWAVPRKSLLESAVTSPDLDAGFALLKTLRQHGHIVRQANIHQSIRWGHMKMTQHILDLHIQEHGPTLDKQATYDHYLLAAAQSNNIPVLSLLVDTYGADINWRPEAISNMSYSRDEVEAEVYDGNVRGQSVFQAAANAGSVDAVGVCVGVPAARVLGGEAGKEQGVCRQGGKAGGGLEGAGAVWVGFEVEVLGELLD